MYENFHKLEPDKQRRIINAALTEFATSGYSRASTEQIAARAGISKGALFHYFGSKQQLYTFLLEWSVETLEREVYGRIDTTSSDLFERMLQGSKLKLQTLLAYPGLFDFWESLMSAPPPFASAWLAEKTAEVAPRGTSMLLEGVDTSRFKPGVDVGKVMNVVIWMFSGWSDAIMAEARTRGERVDLRHVFDEADEYVEFLRNIFYREDADREDVVQA